MFLIKQQMQGSIDMSINIDGLIFSCAPKL